MGTREGHGRASSEDGDGPSARMTTVARACFAPWPCHASFCPWPSATQAPSTTASGSRFTCRSTTESCRCPRSARRAGRASDPTVARHPWPRTDRGGRERWERWERGEMGRGRAAPLLFLLCSHCTPLHSTPPCVARCPAARRRAGRASTASSRPMRSGAAARSAARRSAPVRRKKAGTLARFAGRRRTR